MTNAFVHASMDRDVYMRMPKGYQKRRTILKLQKALYGLRTSPLLWQKEFTTALKACGYQTGPHELCCSIKGDIASLTTFFLVPCRRYNSRLPRQNFWRYYKSPKKQISPFAYSENLRFGYLPIIPLSSTATTHSP